MNLKLEGKFNGHLAHSEDEEDYSLEKKRSIKDITTRRKY